MFTLLDNGRPLLHRFVAKYMQDVPVVGVDGKSITDARGVVTQQVESSTIFCSKDDLDGFVASNPEISVNVEAIDVSGYEWIEGYRFGSNADCRDAVSAGEGCNMFYFEKDGIHRARAVIELKRNGLDVDEKLHNQAIEFILR